MIIGYLLHRKNSHTLPNTVEVSIINTRLKVYTGTDTMMNPRSIRQWAIKSCNINGNIFQPYILLQIYIIYDIFVFYNLENFAILFISH